MKSIEHKLYDKIYWGIINPHAEILIYKKRQINWLSITGWSTITTVDNYFLIDINEDDEIKWYKDEIK